jgi:hypothetical protein
MSQGNPSAHLLLLCISIIIVCATAFVLHLQRLIQYWQLIFINNVSEACINLALAFAIGLVPLLLSAIYTCNMIPGIHVLLGCGLYLGVLQYTSYAGKEKSLQHQDYPGLTYKWVDGWIDVPITTALLFLLGFLILVAHIDTHVRNGFTLLYMCMTPLITTDLVYHFTEALNQPTRPNRGVTTSNGRGHSTDGV